MRLIDILTIIIALIMALVFLKTKLIYSRFRNVELSKLKTMII